MRETQVVDVGVDVGVFSGLSFAAVPGIVSSAGWSPTPGHGGSSRRLASGYRPAQQGAELLLCWFDFNVHLCPPGN